MDKYKKFFDMSEDIFCITDFKGNFIDVNPAFQNILQYRKEEVIGNSILNYIHSEDREYTINSLIEISEGKKNVICKNRYLIKNGDFRWFLWNTFIDLKSELIYAVGTDITQLIEYEELLNKGEKRIEEANRVKNYFIEDICHEARNFLYGIIGAIDYLVRSELDNKNKEFVDILRNCSEEMFEMLNNAMNISNVKQGDNILVNKSFGVSKTIYQCVDNYKHLAEIKGLKINCNITEDVPKYLIGDVIKIKEIINNLVYNSIKFTNEGEVSINVSLKNIEKQFAEVEIAIKDTGIGFDMEKSNHIFKRYAQLKENDDIKEGKGLGLNITKKIIDAMEGQMDIYSKIGQGSEFIITLNLEIDKCRKGEKEEKKSTDKIESNSRVKDINILLVEDNIVYQKLVARVLKKKEWNVEIASNGLEAIHKFREGKFDVILMDIIMPKMDGYEVTRVIRQQEECKKKYTPIIAMTAYAMKADKEKYLEAGMDSYLSKPIVAEEMYKKIEKAVTYPYGYYKYEENFLNSVENLGGDMELMKELIVIFLDTYENIIDKINLAVNNRDFTMIKKNIHTLKGSIINFGCMYIKKLCINAEGFCVKKDIVAIEKELKKIYSSVCSFTVFLESKL